MKHSEKASRIAWLRCLSGAELAAILEVDRQSVAGWTLKGCPRHEDKSYSLLDVIRWRQEYTTRDKSNLEAEQIRKTAAQATLAEMKIAEEENRLVERDLILRVIGEHITTASKRIGDLPRVLAGILPENMRSGFIVQAEGEVFQLLKDLADDRDIQNITHKRKDLQLKKEEVNTDNE